MQKPLGRLIACSLLIAATVLAGGCPANNPALTTTAPQLGPATFSAVDFSDGIQLAPWVQSTDAPMDQTPARPTDQTGNPAVVLNAARNEWTSFTVQITLPAPSGFKLQLHPPTLGATTFGLSSFRIYQALPMPVEMNRASYVRHTGQMAAPRNPPRALLAQTINAGGEVDLALLRNPARAADPRSHAGGLGSKPVLLWFDLRVPKGIAPGQYAGVVDLIGPGNAPTASHALPFNVNVADFDLPDQRHLQLVGKLDWDRLEKLYSDQFETFTPSWINRREGRYQQTVRTLDHLVALAQENRANLTAPDLKPVVKWPAGEGPQIDWADFDSMVRPWITGDAFADHVGLGFLPMPEAELLDRYDRPSQLQYWAAAATHFDANEWLDLTAIVMKNAPPDSFSRHHATVAEAANLSAAAAEIFKCYPRVKTIIPLADKELRLATAADPSGIDPATVSRLITAAAPLVSTAGRPQWGEERPRHWLTTDMPGLVPFFGAGATERDARVWAWLAYLRHLDSYGASHVFEPNSIFWNSTLPIANTPEQSADPGELVWFYPGEWFGVDLPLPTVQLKWLRQAEQDYEYLLLAQDRGEQITALQLARLITKPVELNTGQTPEPIYSLMAGATDPQAWINARQLLSDAIVLHKPGQKIDEAAEHELEIRTLQLSAPLERPILMGRSAAWSSIEAPPSRRDPGTWVSLDLGLDIYNASETTPDQNHLHWSRLPEGWEVKPQETPVPMLETYHVLPTMLGQKFNLDRLSPAAREPMELYFVDGFTKRISPLRIVLPVAASGRRETALKMDGTLGDWSGTDAIWDGPMIRMLNRPAVQRQELQWSSTRSNLFSSWGPENFYLAFALEGLAPRPEQTKNFVEYEDRRAWGEDLCEILMQPILPGNKPGAILHIIAKPTGGVWVERKSAGGAGTWQPVESPGIRYVAATPASSWRGEMAIPWTAILGGANDVPKLMRFNFTQHKAATGESATWAGPVDFGRDEAFMGLIYLKSAGQ
ncbi:MAG TPA: hypothetical protein VG326_18395 [Tepidisphaeraceae bacterium]|jgi:hypothetical protein|nr:hypothetical protein [Tepidisphaeraceae bacterium]